MDRHWSLWRVKLLSLETTHFRLSGLGNLIPRAQLFNLSITANITIEYPVILVSSATMNVLTPLFQPVAMTIHYTKVTIHMGHSFSERILNCYKGHDLSWPMMVAAYIWKRSWRLATEWTYIVCGFNYFHPMAYAHHYYKVNLKSLKSNKNSLSWSCCIMPDTFDTCFSLRYSSPLACT